MLKENIKALRKAKGLSQEALAARLNVVRQTVSKWEQGLSVPDAQLLIALSQALEVPVSTLLGEPAAEPDGLKEIAEQLEAINLALARKQAARRRLLHRLLILLCIALAAAFALLIREGSPYLGWDYRDPETAVLGVGLHSLEWLFVRAAPIAFIGAAVGAFLTGKRR